MGMNTFCRLYGSVAKSHLAALRRKTGFPLGKCKEALVENTDDLEAAESWLYSQAQVEGWAKVEILRNRTANQGLIGLLTRGNRGTMVEVNCETDFVAKNEIFQSLVSNVTRALFARQSFPETSLSSIYLTAEQLGMLETNQASLSDVVASSVGRLGENLVLQRGCVLSSSEEGMVCGHVYNNVTPSGADIAMGKYAALLHLTPTNGSFGDRVAIAKLGQDLGQHIIGINPEVIDEGDEGVSDPSKVLTKQRFVLDETKHIGDMLNEHGAQVTQFVRYALGEH